MSRTTTRAERDDRSTDVQPVFLLSSERSGSNLVRSILNTHTDISAPHPLETAYPWHHLVPPEELSPGRRRTLVRDVIINKHYSFHPLTVPLDVDRVADRVEAADSLSFLSIQDALYTECAAVEDTSVWVSKSPGLWQCLDALREYYPDGKFVYLVRDPRDVALSFKTSNIKFYHPYFSANRWREEQSTGIGLLDDLDDDRIHLVQYEDLLQNPETVVEGACEFVGVPYEEAMLYYYETEDARAASDSAEVFENLAVPIKSDNYGKFRDGLPDDEVKLVEKIAREECDYFGYDRVYTDAELDRFELEPEERYARADRRLERRARLRFWRRSPREQLKRHLTTSFTAYLYLRYGVLA